MRKSTAKKCVAIICVLAMLASMTACGKTDTSETVSTAAQVQVQQQTIYGQVSSVDGTSVTVLLGEMDADNVPGMDGAEKPSDMPKNGSTGDGQTPPELPDGEMTMDGQTQPEMPGGGAGNDQVQSGSAGNKPGSGKNGANSGRPAGDFVDGQEVPDKPDGQGGPDAPDKPQGNGNFRQDGRRSGFTAGTETAVYDLSNAQILVSDMGQTTEGSMGDIAEGVILELVVENDTVITATVRSGNTIGGMGSKDGMGDMGGMGNMGFGGSQQFVEGDAANVIDADGSVSNVTYTSTGDDENALRIEGAAVTLDAITVVKSAGETSNTENGDFYGVNAGLLALDGAQVTITGATVETSAQNGNGVFSYGSGTVVTISDSVITTTEDNSGGIQTTGDGTTIAANLTIETSGSSSAAIRSDRGGGTVDVDGGSYVTNGYNSPAVYSTADITVKNAVLTANNSEALVIEGKNSMTLIACVATGNMSDTMGTSSDINVHNVMIYQSMSGDAEVGTSQFSMSGGSLTGRNGDMFYITNTHCILSLDGVEIINEEENGYLLRAVGNNASRGWGNAGANGAQVEFTAANQILDGDILVDTISTLTVVLTSGSEFTGTINIADNEEGGAAVSDNAVISIEAGCTWNLTGNCTITNLTNNGTINYNGYTITLADGTVMG